MLEVNTIGLDLAKNVFQAHGADGSGAVLFRKKLHCDQVLRFLIVRQLPGGQCQLVPPRERTV